MDVKLIQIKEKIFTTKLLLFVEAKNFRLHKFVLSKREHGSNFTCVEALQV